MKKNAKPPSRLKILFADDETTIRELIQAELPRMGHHVTVCADRRIEEELNWVITWELFSLDGQVDSACEIG